MPIAQKLYLIFTFKLQFLSLVTRDGDIGFGYFSEPEFLFPTLGLYNFDAFILKVIICFECTL